VSLLSHPRVLAGGIPSMPATFASSWVLDRWHWVSRKVVAQDFGILRGLHTWMFVGSACMRSFGLELVRTEEARVGELEITGSSMHRPYAGGGRRSFDDKY